MKPQATGTPEHWHNYNRYSGFAVTCGGGSLTLHSLRWADAASKGNLLINAGGRLGRALRASLLTASAAFQVPTDYFASVALEEKEGSPSNPSVVVIFSLRPEAMVYTYKSYCPSENSPQYTT